MLSTLNLFFKKAPFIRIVIPLVLGIYCSCKLSDIDSIIAVVASSALFLMFCSFVWWQKRKHNYKLRYLTGLLAFLVLFTNAILYSQIREPKIIETTQRACIKVQLIETIGETDKNFKHEAVLCTGESDTLSSFNGSKGIVYIPKSFKGDRTLGEHLHLYGRFLPFTTTAGPFDFDYGNYLRNQRVAFRFIAVEYQYAEEEAGFQVALFSATIKKYLREKYKEGGLDDSQLAILNALFLGDKNLLTYEQKASFSDAGAMHLLAVSGLHVGIIYMLLLGLVSLFGVKKHNPWATFLIIVMLWFYAAVTGFSPSVLRASLMFTILELGRLSNRHTGIFNLLGASMFIILLIEPLSVFNIGFWLSHAAVASIVSFYPKINGWFHFRFPPFKWCWSIVAVSLAAQIGTLPLSIYAFHEFPLYFILTNILLIPIVTPILILAVFAAVMSFSSFGLQLLVPALGNLLTFMENAAFRIDDLPYSSVNNLFIAGWQLPLFYTSLIFLLAYVNYRFIHYFRYLLVSLVVLLLSFHIRLYSLPDEVLYVADINGKSVVNCLNPSGNVIYSDAELSQKEIEFAFGGLWAYCNAPLKYTIVELDSKPNSSPIVTLLGNRSIAIVPKAAYWEQALHLCSVDYLVLMGQPDMEFSEVLKTLHIGQLIIPSGWKRYHKNWYSKYSKSIEKLHEVSDQGVFYLAF